MLLAEHTQIEFYDIVDIRAFFRKRAWLIDRIGEELWDTIFDKNKAHPLSFERDLSIWISGYRGMSEPGYGRTQ